MSPPVEAPSLPARVFVQPESHHRDESPACLEVDRRDGVVRRLLNGRREEVEGGATRRAEVRFATQPEWVFHDAAGWHFISASNRWRADDFLGTPEQVQRAPGRLVGRGVGRAVTLYDGAVEELAVPGVVMDAAFADANAGVAVVEPGVALQTLDGGATWRHLRAGDVLTDVIATPQGVFVLGQQHLWRLDGSDLTHAQGELLRREWCDAPEGQDGGGRPRILPSATWADDAHTSLLLDDLGARYDLLEDRVEPAPEPPCPNPEPVLGSRQVVVCAGEHGRETVYFRGARGAWVGMGAVRRCGRRCVASSGGTRVACEGRCDPEGECDGVSTVCELTSGARARERRYGDGRRSFTPVGYDGAALVVVDNRAHLSHAEFVRGDDAPQRLCPNLNAPRWTRRESDRSPALLGPEGTIEFELDAPEPAAHRRIIVVRPGGGCGVREVTVDDEPVVPEREAVPGQWERACGREGRALAFHDDATWVRDAAGGAWRRFDETLPGVDRAWVHERLRDGDLACTEVGLWFGRGEVAVVGWGTPVPARSVEIGVADEPRGFRFRGMQREWPCELAEEPRSFPAPPQTPDGHRWSQVVLGRRRLWIGVPTATPDGLPGVTWQGFDARGITHSEETRIWAARPERDEALVGITDMAGASFALWRVSTRAPAVHIDDVGTVTEASNDVRTATAGGVTALLWESGQGLAEGTQVDLLRVEGRRLQRSTVVLSRHARDPVLAYVLLGEAGVARLRDDGSLVGAAPGGAPRVLARAGGLGACGLAAEGAASGIRRVHLPNAGSWENVELDFAFEGDRLCLRGARDAGVGARFEGGALIVTRQGPDRRWRLTCRPPVP